MKPPNSIPRILGARHLRGDRLKDEVYRQMYRLEERRQDSAIGLALALLRAWVAEDAKIDSAAKRSWLMKISPICIQMIEKSLRSECAEGSSEE
jgi:hypothetical protein